MAAHTALTSRRWVVPVGAALALVTPFVYLAAARLAGVEPGFPVDDAWIHQMFAANLARLGVFAFNPDQPSTGSTSPFWSLLLAGGSAAGLPLYAWTLLLGGLSLAAAGGTTYLLAARLFPTRRWLPAAAAMLVVLEWHFAWGAASGMETVLFSALAVGLVALGSDERIDPLVLGTLGGITILTRLEGAVLLAIVLVVRLVWKSLGEEAEPLVRRLLPLVATGLVALAIVLPYAWYSVILSGTPLPSTLAAKSAFYGQPVDLAFAARFAAAVLGRLAISPLTVLAPLAVVGLGLAIRRYGRSRVTDRQAVAWAIIALWAFALGGLYLFRLPVVYHHARYFVPLLPCALVGLLSGVALLLDRVERPTLRFGLLALPAGAWIAFWWLGLSTWLFDVRFINAYQVAAGRWVQENVPADATVATHDVGAIRWFGGRQVYDLAGLMTAEVLPAVRDGEALRALVEERRIEYLVVLEDWLPGLTDDDRLIEQARFFTPPVRAAGSGDLVVYRAKWR